MLSFFYVCGAVVLFLSNAVMQTGGRVHLIVGEGLFPANFVTADLTAEVEPEMSLS
jgi:hypothetical protein